MTTTTPPAEHHHVDDADALEALAADVARRLRPPVVLLLEGDLGAGKTTFVRGFVRGLAGGDGVVVQSPTFALARSYPTTPPVHHVDLYRLHDAAAAEALGLDELFFDPAALVLVEWPRDLADHLRGARVGTVRISGGPAGRDVALALPP